MFLRHLIQQSRSTGFLKAEDIRNAAKLLGTDIVIAYGLSQTHQYDVAHDCYTADLWVPPDLEKAMCAICHPLFLVFSPGLKIIDILTDRPSRRAGTRLESFSNEVSAVRLYNHPVHGDHIVLVDTPGFDDTSKSDLEVLQMISNWLRKL